MALKTLRPSLQSKDLACVAPAPKRTDALYGSAAYRDWAQQVKDRAGWRCQACRATEGRMYADHVVEVTDGGARFDVGNGQCLCAACHTRKTARERERRLSRQG